MFRQSIITTLYLGLTPPANTAERRFVHLPVIEIAPRQALYPPIVEFYQDIHLCSHGIFTSKSAVQIFFGYRDFFGISAHEMEHFKMIAVGRATAEELRRHGVDHLLVAREETAEGVCVILQEELEKMKKTEKAPYFFWPHSALSRSQITDFFILRGCCYKEAVFYDVHFRQPDDIPCLKSIDEIVFTSPSTIEGFLRLYGSIPWDKRIISIGPVTEKQLFLLRD